MTTPSNFSIRCSPPRPQRYCTSPRSTMAWMHSLPSTSCVTQVAGHSDYFRKHLVLAAFGGGEGGIRTPDTVTRMPHFECGAFNHSATSPWPQKEQTIPVARRLCIQREKAKQERRRPTQPVIVALDGAPVAEELSNKPRTSARPRSPRPTR